MVTILEQLSTNSSILQNPVGVIGIICIKPYISGNDINNTKFQDGCFLESGDKTPDAVFKTTAIQSLVDAGRLIEV